MGQLRAVQWVWRARIDVGALNCEDVYRCDVALQSAASMALVVIQRRSEGEIVEPGVLAS